MSLNLYLTSQTKSNCIWLTGQAVKPQMKKSLERNTFSQLSHLLCLWSKLQLLRTQKIINSKGKN